MAGVLCALLLGLFFESGVCASMHQMRHAENEGSCQQTHLHNRACDVPSSPTPCRDNCHFEHQHERLAAATTKDSATTSPPLLHPSSLLLGFAPLDAPSSSITPVKLALPPPELQRSTVLLI